MTLHWWMHWFWITYQIYVVCCESVTSPMHSDNDETTIIPLRYFIKHNGSSTYIPPITTANATEYLNSTATPTKIYKSSKKQELSANMTNKFSLPTEYPLIKESTVIDQNVADASLNISNTTYNAINHNANLSYVYNESSINQSMIVNSERISIPDNQTNGSLSIAGITGITLGCVSIIGVVCAVSFVMYRNYGFNRPQVLNDRCSNPDSSGYIDDSTVRENSEEMYSLDNDSFLNSLEAMTIQNLWTDTVKHTKL